MRKLNTVATLLAATLILVLFNPAVAAPIMYGGLGGHANGDSTNDGALGIIDQTTGVVTIVGHPSGVTRISGLAFDLNGNLYGATQGSFPFPPVTPPSPSALIQINPTTGALINDIGNITASGVPINISDLTVQPGTGILFGIRGPNDGNNGQGLLYTINKTTGVATLVGDTHSFFDSIAFGPNGMLYLSAADLDFTTGNQINFRLETLNPTNAAMLTTVAATQFYGALGVRPTDGVIFAGNGDQGQLFTLNATTGAQTLIGSTGRNFVGDIDFLTPEPGTFILLSLGALGLYAIRHRRAPKHRSRLAA
jgi:hypothetical protein